MRAPHYDINPRQWRFVKEYLIDLNGTQAAVRAGYAPESAHVQASRLLRNDKVSAEIERLQRLDSYGRTVTRESVVVSFMQIAEDAMEAGKHRESLKALDYLARHLGMFNECCQHCIQAQKDAAQARRLSGILRSR